MSTGILTTGFRPIHAVLYQWDDNDRHVSPWTLYDTVVVKAAGPICTSFFTDVGPLSEKTLAQCNFLQSRVLPMPQEFVITSIDLESEYEPASFCACATLHIGDIIYGNYPPGITFMELNQGIYVSAGQGLYADLITLPPHIGQVWYRLRLNGMMAFSKQ